MAEFPKEIIQHIQSFLETTEAAETSLVSNSWFKAWSTRPSLSFNFDYNKNANNKNSFWTFVNKTLERYIRLNLKLKKLALMLEFDKENDVNNSPVDKLIQDGLALRVSVLHVDVTNFPKYVLHVGVFEHVYLKELMLFFCKIGCLGSVRCSSLVSLVLGHVCVENDVFARVLLGCPLIEVLKMFGSFKGLTKMNVGGLRKVKTLFVESYERISVEFGCSRFVELRLLYLKNADIDCSVFGSKVQFKFPCLEDLSLLNCKGYRDIHIPSKTLKFLNVIRGGEVEKLVVDVPKLIVFRFNSEDIPVLSFAASKEAKCEITLKCYDCDGVSWFEKLRDFLVKLGCSNISLNVSILSELLDDEFVAPAMNNESPPVVEKLVVKCEEFSFFLGLLLWSCRPKMVTQTSYGDMEEVQDLYEKLVEQTVEPSSDSSSQSIYDLKEVSLELFEESSMEWQPTEASPNTWEILENEGPESVRLRLTWGSLIPQEDTIIDFVQASAEDMIPRGGSFVMFIPSRAT